jgi:S1-C subfamily serine protease
MQRGDIIRKIDDLEIGDLYVYMEALGTLEPGTKSVVVVERNGKPMTLNITWD